MMYGTDTLLFLAILAVLFALIKFINRETPMPRKPVVKREPKPEPETLPAIEYLERAGQRRAGEHDWGNRK